MYQALYRKYRPTVFDDVVGQEHITETLKNSLKLGKIFHAYLFTGTRGTGKTTCAKILANAICCENPVDGQPCGECAACKLISRGSVTDISEIDAASNNGVDYIRDLREQVQFLPVSLKYRVYIIDEVHMLSTQAFNALLKTLEEPPAHVVFILATTEVHKLPATILSRCQRFDFHRMEPETICNRIKKVSESEGFKVEPDAALKIAALADGGMRDALSILDQCSAVGGDVTLEVIADVCGVAGDTEILNLTSAIGKGNTAEAIGIIDKLYRNSVDMKKLIFELISCFRNLMIIKTVKDTKELIICSEDELKKYKAVAEIFSLNDIIENLTVLQSVGENISVSAARSDTELAIVKLCTPELKNSSQTLLKRIEELEDKISKISLGVVSAPAKVKEPSQKSNVYGNELIPPPDNSESYGLAADSVKKAHTVSDDSPVLVSRWPEILEIIKKTCPLIGGVLADSKAYIGGGRLLIDSSLDDQFRDLINSDASYRDCIRKAAYQVLGVSYNLGPYRPARKHKEISDDPLVSFAKSLEEEKNL